MMVYTIVYHFEMSSRWTNKTFCHYELSEGLDAGVKSEPDVQALVCLLSF